MTTYHDIAHAAGVARKKKRLARELRALGCDPRATVRGVERRANQDLARLSREARPFIESGESLRGA